MSLATFTTSSGFRIKVAALVGQSVRRITFQLPVAFPMADVFVAVARATGATPPPPCMSRRAPRAQGAKLCGRRCKRCRAPEIHGAQRS